MFSFEFTESSNKSKKKNNGLIIGVSVVSFVEILLISAGIWFFWRKHMVSNRRKKRKREEVNRIEIGLECTHKSITFGQV